MEDEASSRKKRRTHWLDWIKTAKSWWLRGIHFAWEIQGSTLLWDLDLIMTRIRLSNLKNRIVFLLFNSYVTAVNYHKYTRIDKSIYSCQASKSASTVFCKYMIVWEKYEYLKALVIPVIRPPSIKRFHRLANVNFFFQKFCKMRGRILQMRTSPVVLNSQRILQSHRHIHVVVPASKLASSANGSLNIGYSNISTFESHSPLKAPLSWIGPDPVE